LRWHLASVSPRARNVEAPRPPIPDGNSARRRRAATVLNRFGRKRRECPRMSYKVVCEVAVPCSNNPGSKE
jgi:hypothetical protein